MALAVLLPASASYGQADADSLVWELVGQTFQVEGLFAAGVVAEGTGDLAPAVYAIGFDGLFVIHPGDEVWTLVASRSELRADEDAFVSRDGTLLANSFHSIYRSPDGGETWVQVDDGVNIAPIHTPAGALIAGLDGDPSDTVARSTDDGLTWEHIDMWPTLEGRILPLTFATLPVSAALPGGRIVAGGNDAIVYSDDDGFSWQPTNLYAGFRYRVSSIVRAPWGLLYAAVNDFAVNDIGGVWESTDGAVWERMGRVPGDDATGAQIVAVGDSTLYGIYLTENKDIQVYRSEDRGRTWVGTGRIAAEEAVGNPVRMQELIVGPEGRLWLGMTQGTGGPGLTGGVFRTVEPVFPVSAEGGPEPGKPVAELGAAYPNPSSGAVTVPLVLPEAAEVSVAVFDVLGRRVAVLHDGRLGAGEHTFDLNGAVFPPGVYVVRAEVGGQRFTERLTVMR